MGDRFEYRLSRDEYVAGLSVLTEELRLRDPWRSRVLWEQGIAILAIILLVTVLFPAGVFAVLIVCFFVSLFEFVMRPRWARGMTGVSYDPAVAEEVVEIDDAGVSQRSAARLRSWPWESVRQAHDVDAGVVLELAGWDMVMLPARLWQDSEDQRAFVMRLPCAVAERRESQPKKIPAPAFSTMLPIAALAAAVEALAIVTGLLPLPRAEHVALGENGIFLAAFAAAILVAALFAYAVFRVARTLLVRLHDKSPRVAEVAVQALLWAIPLYFIAAYFGWL